jgi:predicted PurR-regulated permease PerM
MFFALLGGLQVFGLVGIVLGPVIFAIAASVLDVLSERRPVLVAPPTAPPASPPPGADPTP